MYGTIARLHPSPGRKADLEAYGSRVADVPIDGVVGAWLFTPDRDPYARETAFLVAIFEDEASYRANADSPAQHERYLEMRALLDDDPDWMDGTFTVGP
jgi:hypothetical protein